MERVDPNKAAAVWQRVHATGQTKPNLRELPAIIQQILTDMSIYQSLSRKISANPLPQQLYRLCSGQAACLRGICRMATGTFPPPFTPGTPQEPVEPALRHNYSHALQRISKYESLSTDPEYGIVFAQLAQQEKEHCRFIPELLGSMKER